MEGVRLHGRLVSGGERQDTSCLVWHPDLSRVASPLQNGPAGRIVYREPPPAPPKIVRPQTKGRVVNVVAQPAAGLGPVLAKVLKGDNPAQPATTTAGKRSLHLRSGDTILCDVVGIDENGVRLRTPLLDTTF